MDCLTKFVNDYAKRSLSEARLKEYDAACEVIAKEIEGIPRDARADALREMVTETLQLYEAGRRYAVDKDDFDKCVALGRALETFEKASVLDTEECD